MPAHVRHSRITSRGRRSSPAMKAKASLSESTRRSREVGATPSPVRVSSVGFSYTGYCQAIASSARLVAPRGVVQ